MEQANKLNEKINSTMASIKRAKNLVNADDIGIERINVNSEFGVWLFDEDVKIVMTKVLEVLEDKLLALETDFESL